MSKRALGTFLLFIFMAWSLSADAGKRSEAENAEIDSRSLWKYGCSGAIRRLELMSNGDLHVVCHVGEGKKSPQKRLLINKSGRVYWEKDAETTGLLAVHSRPIILELNGRQAELVVVGPTGADDWRSPVLGIPISVASRASEDTIILLSLSAQLLHDPKAPQEATLVAYSLASGARRWQTPLGPISNSLDLAGRELEISHGSVWWAGGGRVARVNLSSGQIVWNTSYDVAGGLGTGWYITSDGAWFADHGNVISFSPSGPKWQRNLGKNNYFTGMLLKPAGLVVSFVGKKGLTLAVLDPASGSPRWTKEIKNKGTPPIGMAVEGNRVVVAAGRKLLGYSLDSGQELFGEKIEKKYFSGFRELRARPGHAVLIGTNSASAYDMNTGKLLWHQKGFKDPYEEKKKSIQMMAQVAGYAMNPAPSPKSKVEKDGSTMTITTTYPSVIEQMAYEQDVKNFSKSITDLSSWVTINQGVFNERLGAGYATFTRIMDSKFEFGFNPASTINAVLLDLDTGIPQTFTLRESSTGCSTTSLIDPVGRRVIQSYQQLGLLCKDEHRMEAYRF